MNEFLRKNLGKAVKQQQQLREANQGSSIWSFLCSLSTQPEILPITDLFDIRDIIFFFKHLYWSIIALQWCVSFFFITK